MAKLLANRVYSYRHPVTAFTLLVLVFSVVGLASGSEIEFIVDRADGAVYIRNTASTARVFDGYSIESPGESLIVGAWSSVADNYDLSGNQSVDSTANWFVLGTPTAENVAEASPVEGSGSLAPGQVVSLGLFFDTNLFEGLIVTTSANGTTSDPFLAFFRNLEADYDADLDVDEDDYGIFADTFGSTIDPRADGNNDGVVDAIDYTVWRDSPSLSLATTAGLPASLGSAIPEPASAWMAGLALLSSMRRRRAQ